MPVLTILVVIQNNSKRWKMGTRFVKGNRAARKRRWTDKEILSYQRRVQTIINSIGLAEVARLLDYQPEYVKLIAGYYDLKRQPSEEFVRRFERAEFLHHIRTVTVPFLREREGQGPGRTWTRRRARVAQSRQKRGTRQ